jgi:hypothetical protein
VSERKGANGTITADIKDLPRIAGHNNYPRARRLRDSERYFAAFQTRNFLFDLFSKVFFGRFWSTAGGNFEAMHEKEEDRERMAFHTFAYREWASLVRGKVSSFTRSSYSYHAHSLFKSQQGIKEIYLRMHGHGEKVIFNRQLCLSSDLLPSFLPSHACPRPVFA